jgi:hypothetical protein
MTTQSDTPDAKIAGYTLMASAALIVFAMGHHPSGGHGQTPLVAGLSLSKLVHGGMIIFVLAQAWGLSVHARLRGPGGWAQAGLLVYLLGAVGHLIAGTINGFVVPAMGEAPHEHYLMLWNMNQAFAGFGAMASSAAILFWSIDLLTKDPRGRIIGLIGLGVALVPAGAFLSGAIGLDVAGAFLIYASHALWAGLIGWRMRG